MIGPGIPGATLEAFAEGFACGQAGVITVTIDDGDGNNVFGPTTASIIEIECSPDVFGVYRFLGTYPGPASDTPYVITWEGPSGSDPNIQTTATEEILVSADEPAMPEAVGPCTPWIDWEDILACCDAEVGSESQAELEVAAQNATLVLFVVSGGRFTGLCGPITERPVLYECPTWQRWQYRDGSIGPIWNSAGGYWDAGGRCCGCGGVSEVRLGNYPVQGVAQVKVDGAVVAPSEYRVDQNHLLVRKDDGRWPTCQNLSRDDDDAGTFSVSYWYGEKAPQLAKDAAAALGCEFFKACNPEAGECELPPGWTQVVRQGITVERAQTLVALIKAGSTGNQFIDAFVAMFGKADRQKPAVWSPDLPWPRRVPS